MAQLKDLLVLGAARFLNGINVFGDFVLAGNLLPAEDGKYNIGSSTLRWKEAHLKNLFVINDDSNSAYDAMVYFKNYSSKDWGLILDKEDYDYGIKLVTGGTNGLNMYYMNTTSNRYMIGTTNSTGVQWNLRSTYNSNKGQALLASNTTYGGRLYLHGGATLEARAYDTTSYLNLYGTNNNTDNQRGLELKADTQGGNIRIYSPANYLYYTDASNGTTNHYWEIDAYNRHLRFYNYYGGSETAASTLRQIRFNSQGNIWSNSNASSWINGQKTESAAYNISDATDTGSYWPWLRQTNSNADVARVFSLGTLSDSVYLISSNSARTSNGYDRGHRFNMSNGNIDFNIPQGDSDRDNKILHSYGRVIVDPYYSTDNSYSEGVRINQASNGWSNVIIGGAKGSSTGAGTTVWLIGRRGAAGSADSSYGGSNAANLVGAVNDLTLEVNGSTGRGLTLPATSGESLTWQQRPVMAQLKAQGADATILNNANYKTAYMATTSNGNSSAGLAVSNWYHIMNFRHLDNNGYNAQIALPLNHDGLHAWRWSNGTTWQPWRYIFDNYHSMVPYTNNANSNITSTFDIGSATSLWRDIFAHHLTLQGKTDSDMSAGSANPRITFAEGNNTQPVHLIYTDYDSYKAPAGLKVIGGSSATPAWFEVEGAIGTSNTSSSTGIGISLYNGPVNGKPTYGLFFGGTGTFGKLNNTTSTAYGITSDWATYFTMSDTTTRGWIFMRGSTNVAGVTGNGTFLTSLTTSSHLAGNQGRVALDMGAAAGYNMALRIKSSDGVFTEGVYSHSRDIYYTADTVISAGTNSFTHSITLLSQKGLTLLKNLIVDNTNHYNDTRDVGGGVIYGYKGFNNGLQSSQLVLGSTSLPYNSTDASAGGGSVGIEFWRGTNASWRLLDEGGIFKFQNNYTDATGVQSSYVNTPFQMHYDGTLTLTGPLRLGSDANGYGKNYIAFYGTTGDGAGSFNHTYIGENLWSASESSELVLFKGNDQGSNENAVTAVGSGADRIRHIAAGHVFQVYRSAMSGTFQTICQSTTPSTVLEINGSGMMLSGLKTISITPTGGSSVSVNQSVLTIFGQTYGNEQTSGGKNPALKSGQVGVFSYGDGGPQIDFSANRTGGQRGALIFTDHDSAGAGASWHFVSTEGDWNVNSKRFVAKSSVTVGANLPNTSYALHVTGQGFFTNNVFINATDTTERYLRVYNSTGSIYVDAASNGRMGLWTNTGGRSDWLLSTTKDNIEAPRLLALTTNSNTVTIGSQNASWTHIYNSANIPFIFNRNVYAMDEFVSYRSGNAYQDRFGNGRIELYGSTPYIDFHFNNTTTDYTSRIIETASGYLQISPKVGINGSSTGYTFYVNGISYFNNTINYHANIVADRSGYGLYLMDGNSQSYAGIYDNGSNLWVGASSSTGMHHKGNTYISAGHTGNSGTDAAGNRSVYISIPNYDATTHVIASHSAYPFAYGAAGSATLPIYVDSNGKTQTITSYGGNSATATALTSSAGSATQPIYFSGGKPVATTYYLKAHINSHQGSLATGGWKILSNRSTSGPIISVAYNNAPAAWNSATYSSSLVFGSGDTRGLLDCGHNSPTVTFGGGSHGGSTDDAPKWYFKVNATHGQTYTFPTTSKTLCASDGSNASGTWGINISGVASWASLLQNKGSGCTASASTWNGSRGGTIVWGERWTSTNYTYTPSGGSATTITDSGDVSFYVKAGSSTSNTLTLNMAIDGEIYAGGGFIGNATSATKATQDGSGNTITSTYVKKAGDTMTGQLYINLDQDVGLNQNGSLVIGNKTGVNIGIDGNEIMARNNSAASTLYLNTEGGNVTVGGYTNTSYALSTSSFICNSWVRTKGSTGWYNEDYGGGWYMSDSTWIRSYNNKSVYTNTGTIRTDGGSVWSDQMRIVSNWIGWYATKGDANSTRYGYIQNDISASGYMRFVREQSGAFLFNATAYFGNTTNSWHGAGSSQVYSNGGECQVHVKTQSYDGYLLMNQTPNFGLYSGGWVIRKDMSGGHVYIADWASIGDSTSTPIYITSSGRPATIPTIAKSETGDIGWGTSGDRQKLLRMSAIAYWNGCYSGTSSNLKYQRYLVFTAASGSYGSSLPSSGETGQVFFKI